MNIEFFSSIHKDWGHWSTEVGDGHIQNKKTPETTLKLHIFIW